MSVVVVALGSIFATGSRAFLFYRDRILKQDHDERVVYDVWCMEYRYGVRVWEKKRCEEGRRNSSLGGGKRVQHQTVLTMHCIIPNIRSKQDVRHLLGQSYRRMRLRRCRSFWICFWGIFGIFQRSKK
ncbi:hypothetical protein F5884DRAFT_294461 [Xylogone sp. PMI_703]|nr:hypothetical protein F5884DRAFT_294461 [Xylogone sp. PMI_703]